MDIAQLECIQCRRELPVENSQTPLPEIRCNACGTRQIHLIFPAAGLQPDDPTPGPLQEGNACCYYHETGAAEVVCDDCGRYLCGLCSIEVPMPANEPPGFPERLCPPCHAHRVAEEVRDGRWDLFRTAYTRYDLWAIRLLFIPIVAFPLIVFSMFTFPMAAYLLLRHGRTCRTPARGYRGTMLGLLLLSLVGMVIWLSIISYSVVNSV